jgi:hypothetical protein
MTTTENTQEILTTEQIARKFLKHNLEIIEDLITSDNKIAESKKNEMAIIIDQVAEIFKNYNKILENLNDKDELNSRFTMERIYKLELFKLISQF